MSLAGASANAAEEPFLAPPQVLRAPGPEHTIGTRKFQGIPSMARAPKCRLWATWYASKAGGEDQFNYVTLATSEDDGKTWTEPVLVVDPDGDGPVRAFDPELWLDPDNRLWLFWAQAMGHNASKGGVWAMVTEQPDGENAEWSAPRRLTDGVMMCKPLVLSSGEWLLPASTWRTTDQSARAIASNDHGKTWALRGGCQVPAKERSFDEHMIVERNDATLWMLVRTKYGIGESVSTDRGKTWPELKPSAIKHTDARFFIRRLASGRLLLVKHGAIDQNVGRSKLTAFLSGDDGKTWPNSLLLDERNHVSYPDGVEAPDGTLYIIYDRERTGAREILMARFAEEDVLQGKLVKEGSQLGMVISKAAN